MPAELPIGWFNKAEDFAFIELADGVTQLFMDVVLSESHSYNSDVTQYPVETGDSVSDNIRPRPIEVSIDGCISNTPFHRNHGPIAPFIDDEGVEQSAHAAFKFLLLVWRERETVTLRTRKGTYKNMAMTALDVPTSPEIGDAFKFSAKFQQIIKVANLRKKVAIRTGNGKTKRGLSPGQEYSKVVLWRRGVTILPNGVQIFKPGALLIGPVFPVHWIPYELSKRQDSGAYEELSFEEKAKVKTLHRAEDAGTWFFEDRKTALTEAEIRDFTKDMARDNRARGNVQRGIAPDPASEARYAADLTGAQRREHYDLNRLSSQGLREDGGEVDDGSVGLFSNKITPFNRHEFE